MRDEVIIRMLQEACKGLERVNFPATTPHLPASYNALLAVAKANHPQHPFLNALEGIETQNGDRDAGPEEMRVLFGQLRILLESLNEPEGYFAPGAPEAERRGADIPERRH